MGFMDQFKDAMSAGAPTGADMEKMQQITRLNEVGVEHPATITSLGKTGRTDPGGVEYEISVDVRPEGAEPYSATFTQFMHEGSMGKLGDRGRRGQGSRRPRRPHGDDPLGRPGVSAALPRLACGASCSSPRLRRGSYPSATAASQSSLICGSGWGESSSTTPRWRPPTFRVIT